MEMVHLRMVIVIAVIGEMIVVGMVVGSKMISGAPPQPQSEGYSS